jgi:acetyl-CoA acyltransferase
MAAQSIMVNQADVVIAGGAESMSSVPMSGHHISPNPYMAENDPHVYMSMGLTAERVASEFGVNRQDQDEFAAWSHEKAAKATDAGYFKQEIVPFEWEETIIGNDGMPTAVTMRLLEDEHLRRGTTPDILAGLKPVFKADGSITAGNSSPLSDGAAGVILMSREKAEALGLTPLARFVGFAVAGVRPEIMGVGPIKAVPKVLERTGMSLDDIDLIELNEAFAAQALACTRSLGIADNDPRINPNGGAIALGHPLGMSGARILQTASIELKASVKKHAICTMCIGVGQGYAVVIERC